MEHRALFDAEVEEGQQERDQDAADPAEDRTEEHPDEGVRQGVWGIRLSPIIAAAAMALSSLSVVTNASRLRRWHPEPLPEAGTSAQEEVTVESAAERTAGSGGAERVTDPVCGMQVDPATASEQRHTPDGTRYFCSAHCAAAYDVEPRRYAGTPAVGGHTSHDEHEHH